MPARSKARKRRSSSTTSCNELGRVLINLRGRSGRCPLVPEERRKSGHFNTAALGQIPTSSDTRRRTADAEPGLR
jgi:hypothetical protein